MPSSPPAPVRSQYYAPSTAQLVKLVEDQCQNSRRQAPRELPVDEATGKVMIPGITVDLGHLNIEHLPERIIDMVKDEIERLAISTNRLVTFPLKLAECTHLRYLNVRGNSLTAVPPAFLLLKKLEVLDISKNHIKIVPEEIIDLVALKVLSLEKNEITELPFILGESKNLVCLKLRGNPLKPPLSDVCNLEPEGPPHRDDYQKEIMVTKAIKQWLKKAPSRLRLRAENDDESSESPVETPRPPAVGRNTGMGKQRFPVKPSIGGSEGFAETNVSSPIIPMPPPPIPLRSHARTQSKTRRMGMITPRLNDKTPTLRLNDKASTLSSANSSSKSLTYVNQNPSAAIYLNERPNRDPEAQELRETHSTLASSQQEPLSVRLTLALLPAVEPTFESIDKIIRWSTDRPAVTNLQSQMRGQLHLTRESVEELQSMLGAWKEVTQNHVEYLTDIQKGAQELFKQHMALIRSYKALRTVCEVEKINFLPIAVEMQRLAFKENECIFIVRDWFPQVMKYLPQLVPRPDHPQLHQLKLALAVQSPVPPIPSTSSSLVVTGHIMGHPRSAMASPPGSADSYSTFTPATSRLNIIPRSEGSYETERLFEKIYIKLRTACDSATDALPGFEAYFTRQHENAVQGVPVLLHPESTLWVRLAQKSSATLDAALLLRRRLSQIKLNDPSVRTDQHFWATYRTFTKQWSELVETASEAKRQHIISQHIKLAMKPVHDAVKDVGKIITASPWAEAAMTARQTTAAAGPSSVRARLPIGRVGHVPATPLSAALGPAAQATVPTPSNSSLSFSGSVFERADRLLQNPQRRV